MGLKFSKPLTLSLALVLCCNAFAKDNATFGVTSQFLNICDSEASSYEAIGDSINEEYWSQVSEVDLIEDFFPSTDANIINNDIAVYEYFNQGADELFKRAGVLPTEKWFLGVARLNIANKKVIICQIRSYDESIDGLREDFERSTILKKEVVSTESDFKKYAYFSDSKNSFYNVWERQLQDDGYVFAISKSTVEMP